MEVDAFIAALRDDSGPQRRAQAAMERAHRDWIAEVGVRETLSEMHRFGGGAPLQCCPGLERLVTQRGEAERMLALLTAHFCAALARHPVAHPPFRNGFDGRSGSILLARTGRAQLMLQAREPGEYTARNYVCSDATRFDAVIAGKASGRIVRAAPAGEGLVAFQHEEISLLGGDRLALDLASEALVIDRVDRRLVVLRLLRKPEEPEPTREYDAATGRLRHRSAGLIATSRQEAIVALLGRMGRADAAPEMARIAIAASDPSLRWQALRECLALDTGEGFRALTAIARDGQDPLAGDAGALRAQLVENHPELAQWEAAQCPA